MADKSPKQKVTIDKTTSTQVHRDCTLEVTSCENIFNLDKSYSDLTAYTTLALPWYNI